LYPIIIIIVIVIVIVIIIIIILILIFNIILHYPPGIIFSTYGDVGIRHDDTWRLQETYRAPLKVGEWRVAWTKPAQPDTGFSYFWVGFSYESFH